MKEHFKHFLGKASEAWSDDNADELAILLFKNQPQPRISTYATYKMSNHSLALNKEKKVRQELIFSVYEKYESDKIAGSLLSFAKHVIESGKALRRGETVGPGIPFVPDTKLNGLYASSPAFFEDEFHVYNDVTPPVVIVWLIPLLQDEIFYVRNNGWDKFENLLEKANCDFWNIHRESILEAQKL